MKISMTPLRMLACAALCAAALSGLALASTGDVAGGAKHRYMIQRSFPAGALSGLDADAKAKVNQTNAKYGVKWLMSFANGDKSSTFCVYDGPDPEAIRRAAGDNNLPLERITQVNVLAPYFYR